ncbi:uncharacterized protein LOC106770295 [Vigna radiata var. radiata]|uniref:Uncharacterized protein LOC106770295 n=1 Tax=Vigna radiata var. radiata TaxID=3916 RepID=A0A1S3V079_VIGRR|nr:uncharacterized protein LOC106770295 [Vigna radiata var. radiata]
MVNVLFQWRPKKMIIIWAINSNFAKVGQLAKKMEDKAENQFRANTEVNPKEECKAIDNCRVILKKALPSKVEDPRSFTIPCIIRKVKIEKSLIDLGSSINLMPLFMLKRIGGLEVKPTKENFQIADGSTKKPYDVAEDVRVRIDKLEFLVDFVVMEMEEDENIPIILGMPFMKTAKVSINVDEGTIALKDQEEKVIFNVFNVEQ